jgi:hypothetical protein
LLIDRRLESHEKFGGYKVATGHAMIVAAALLQIRVDWR